MRLRSAIALALALCGGCTSPFGNKAEGNNAAESRSGGIAGDATVTVAAVAGNPCAATWNGSPATAEELTNRSFALLDQAIERAGGPQNMGEGSLPRVRLEAAPALTFACVGPIIAAIQRSGIAEIALRPTGAAGQPVSVYTSLVESGEPPPQATIEVGPGGRIKWNGESSDFAGVRARAREIANPEAPPGALAVIVAGDVPFPAAFLLFEAVAAARPILLGPGSTVPPPNVLGLPPPPSDPLAGRRR